MSTENKIDLSGVNKTPKSGKQIRLPKVSIPFKSTKGPARDSEGKFTSGSGGLLASKKLKLGRILPIALVVAVVGGYFVFQSFATTKKTNFQYSAFSCGQINRSKNPDYTCHDFSAEAGVYRAYKAVLGRYPAKTDYKSYVQPMVGGDADAENIPGRLSYTIVIKRLLATPEAKSAKGAMVNNPNDGQLVANVFKNALNRNASNADIFNWVKLKADRKWSNDQLVYQIISSKEAREKQRTTFLADLSGNKIEKFKIIDYATQKQTNRANLAKKINKNNSSTLKATKDRNADNRSRLAASQAIANQAGSTISKGDYEGIKKNNADIIKGRASGFRGPEYMGRVKTRLDQIKKLNDLTNQVKQASPDLVKDDRVKREYDYAAYVRDQMNNEIKHADWLYGETMKAYNAAKKKHDDHQAWAKAKADCEAKGGAFSNWNCRLPQPSPPPADGGSNPPAGGSNPSPAGSGLNPNACTTRVENITRSHGSNCIAKLQRHGGITQDGAWGPNTQRVYDSLHGSGPSSCQAWHVIFNGQCTRLISNPTSSSCPDGFGKKVTELAKIGGVSYKQYRCENGSGQSRRPYLGCNGAYRTARTSSAHYNNRYHCRLPNN